MKEQWLQAAQGKVAVTERNTDGKILKAVCHLADIPSGRAGFIVNALLHVIDVATGVAFLYINTGTALSCTFTPFDFNLPGNRLVASGAALTVTKALHDNKTIVLAAAAAITLPAMTGAGSRYRFVCPQDSTAVTITATGAHLFGGVTVGTDSAFAAGTLFTVGFAANGGGSTIITFDGSTRGGKKGDWVEIEDVATSVGIVRGMLNGSGTEATPFS